MKDAKTVIDHLFSSNIRWRQHRLIRALFAPLPKPMQEAVRFAKLQNGVLTIQLNSPTMKAEFNYKRALLKSIFNMLAKETNLCGDCELLDFRLLVDYTRRAAPPPPAELVYEEQSNGSFANRAENERVSAALERIRVIIKARRR